MPDRGDDLTRGGSRTYRACSCPVLCHRPPAACWWTRPPAGADGTGAEPGYLEFELHKQQVEINTSPAVSLDDLAREVTACRALAAEAVGRAGASLAALGTSPVPAEPAITSKGRHRRMA